VKLLDLKQRGNVIHNAKALRRLARMAYLLELVGFPPADSAIGGSTGTK